MTNGTTTFSNADDYQWKYLLLFYALMLANHRLAKATVELQMVTLLECRIDCKAMDFDEDVCVVMMMMNYWDNKDVLTIRNGHIYLKNE